MKMRMLKLMDKVVGVGVKIWSPRPNLRSSSAPQRILLIRPGGIGDAVLLIPTIRALRQAYPACIIDILAEKRNAAVFAFTPLVRAIYRYDTIPGLSTVMRNRYDVVIDTEQWYRLAAVVARLVRVPVKIGFGTNERARLFTHSVSYSLEAYETESFLSLLQPLGITAPEISVTPFLHISETAAHAACSLLEGTKQFVALFPGASVREKCWGTEKFSSLAARLAERQIAVVVVGGSDDASVGEEVVMRTAGLNLAGRTSLVETAAIIARADVLVSGDSGVLHIAAGLNVSSVSLFGPSSSAKWAPRGRSDRVICAHLACSPCSLYGTIPPCPNDVLCMEKITVDQVLLAIESVLAERADRNKNEEIDKTLDIG
jgi:lipopolysaccharide heptosyltransferase II